jgi:hypothetical protein
VRGGYEFQGQKCSAASRVYVAKSVWDRMREPLLDTIRSIKVGDVTNFSNFMGAVIKQTAFDKHQAAIAEARETSGMKVAAGGVCDGRDGWFVHPTLITTEDPACATCATSSSTDRHAPRHPTPRGTTRSSSSTGPRRTRDRLDLRARPRGDRRTTTAARRRIAATSTTNRPGRWW